MVLVVAVQERHCDALLPADELDQVEVALARVAVPEPEVPELEHQRDIRPAGPADYRGRPGGVPVPVPREQDPAAGWGCERVRVRHPVEHLPVQRREAPARWRRAVQRAPRGQVLIEVGHAQGCIHGPSSVSAKFRRVTRPVGTCRAEQCRPPAGWDHFEVSFAGGMGPPGRQ